MGVVTKVGSLTGSATVCKLDDVMKHFLGCLLIPLCATMLPTTSKKCKMISGMCTCATLVLILLAFNVRAKFFHFTGGSSRSTRGMCTGSLLFIKKLSLLFIILYVTFLRPLSTLLRCPSRPSCVTVVIYIITLSSFRYVPFTCLHCGGQPIGFTTVGLLGVVKGVLLGLFFLLIYP